VFNLIFQYLNFGPLGERVPLGGSTMVQLGMQLLSSHRLTIQTTIVSGTVWPQYAMQVLTVGGCPPPSLGSRGGRIRSEMGPLSSPGTTSYRLPIGLSHRFRSAPDVPDGQTDGRTDGRNWSSNRRHYALKCIGRQKHASGRNFEFC